MRRRWLLDFFGRSRITLDSLTSEDRDELLRLHASSLEQSRFFKAFREARGKHPMGRRGETVAPQGAWARSRSDARLRDWLQRVLDPKCVLTHPVIQPYRRMAMKCLSRRDPLRNIPVALLPSAVQATSYTSTLPSGLPYVAIDATPVLLLPLLFAFQSARSSVLSFPDRFLAYGTAYQGLMLVSLAMVTGDFGWFDLAYQRNSELGSTPTGFRSAYQMANITAGVFLILHEYGHIAKGHLDKNSLDPRSAELEADKFALDALRDRAQKFAGPSDQMIFGPMALLTAFEQGRRVIGIPEDPTYPVFEDRLQQIASILGGKSSYSQEAVSGLIRKANESFEEQSGYMGDTWAYQVSELLKWHT